MNNKPELVVVGAGFFGLTIAERFASVVGKPVLVIDKRSHLGGNAHSEINSKTGVEVHKYGSHLFHTSNESVWNYITQFSKFNSYVHRVFTIHDGQSFPLPVNLQTINQLFGLALNPEGARKLINNQRESLLNTVGDSSFEAKALEVIGPDLYNAFIRGYTMKQWQTDPKNLPAETFSRLPVRFDYNSRYFSDAHEGLPLDGYFKVFERMVENPLIKVELDTDYFDTNYLDQPPTLTIYTGPIDRYFNFKFGELAWRTLDFEFQILDDEDFQGNSVINYADEGVPFTRIHEFKHLHPERWKQSRGTVIAREFSRFASRHDEPYYPVNSSQDRETLSKYRAAANEERNIIFGGRLGRYQYLDMHMAISSALQTFQNDVLPRFIDVG